MLYLYRIITLDEVYIIFLFNIILKHKGISSAKTIPHSCVGKEKQVQKSYIYLNSILIQKAHNASQNTHLYAPINNDALNE